MFPDWHLHKHRLKRFLQDPCIQFVCNSTARKSERVWEDRKGCLFREDYGGLQDESSPSQRFPLPLPFLHPTIGRNTRTHTQCRTRMWSHVYVRGTQLQNISRDFFWLAHQNTFRWPRKMKVNQQGGRLLVWRSLVAQQNQRPSEKICSSQGTVLYSLP